MVSVVFALSPSFAIIPFTVTFPALISSSHFLLLSMPACARIFCTRSIYGFMQEWFNNVVVVEGICRGIFRLFRDEQIRISYRVEHVLFRGLFCSYLQVVSVSYTLVWR